MLSAAWVVGDHAEQIGALKGCDGGGGASGVLLLARGGRGGRGEEGEAAELHL